MRRDRLRPALALAVHLCLFAFAAVPLSALLFFPERPDDGIRYEVFRYYTTLSNVLAGLAAPPAAVCALRGLRTGTYRLPPFLAGWRYMATAMLTLTMMTVLFFLGPLFGYGAMFSRAYFWFHLVNPLLSIAAYCFLERDPAMRRSAVLLGVLPTALYGVVYVRETVFVGADAGGWPDFYGFNIGGHWPLAIAAMLGTNLLLSFLVLLLHNRMGKRGKE